MPSQYKRQNSHNQKTSENRISRCHKTYLRQKNHVSTYRDHAADNRHISPVYCSIRQFIPQRQRIINTLKQISHQHPRQYRQGRGVRISWNACCSRHSCPSYRFRRRWLAIRRWRNRLLLDRRRWPRIYFP